MSKTIGYFDYVLFGGPKEYTSPIIEIRLGRWSEDEQGHITISAHLMTTQEIDAHIDALIQDLEAVRRRAKRAFTRRRSN